MHEGTVIQQPLSKAGRLVLLFHGVGASASDLLPLGTYVARAMPDTMVVSVEAAHVSTLGRGREWFSVLGVTEENRVQRIEDAMEAFGRTVDHWQGEAGADPARTTLIGFSQGAIMSLESTRLRPGICSQVLALSGRFAHPPIHRPTAQTFHFIHGEQDPVIEASHSVQAVSTLQQQGITATLDLFPGLGHGIDARVAAAVVAHLRAPASQEKPA